MEKTILSTGWKNFKWMTSDHWPKDKVVKLPKDNRPMIPLEFKMIHDPETPMPLLRGHRKVVKVGRNTPCPCGSGKKYKKCCIK